MGNRVKGKTKKKSIKAASHSGMGSKRKLSRMGKKRQKDKSGLDATFIGRSACLKRLQLSIKDFRRLCILKGVYPREPRGRAPGNKKGQVYYHIKDVRAIAHEPILDKFREFRAFMKKVRKAAGRNEKDEAARRHALAPTYTLHHLVRERYPRFMDALEDLDDALTLVHLFAALPSEGRIKTKVTTRAKSLAAAWGAYCSITSSITKSFISVKGVYLEASIVGNNASQPTNVRWIIPHAFTQNLPSNKDVDYRVMLTFFEFYDTLLGFVLFKLYSDIGVRYPLSLEDESAASAGSKSSVLASHLKALNSALESSRSGGTVSKVVSESVQQQQQQETENKPKNKRKMKKSKELIKTVGVALNQLADDVDDSEGESEDDDVEEEEIGEPLKAALESMAEAEGREGMSGCVSAVQNEDTTKRRNLFAGLVFFLSREIPRGYLELVSLSYGARVGWEGPSSPLDATDPAITHHIVDRPKLPSSFDGLPTSREYVQPQWIVDCANFMFLLPIAKYGAATKLPPHLSPWVDEEEEGYKPAYAEEVDRLKNGEVVESNVSAAEEAGHAEEEDASEENIEAMQQESDVKEKDESEDRSDDVQELEDEEDEKKIEEECNEEKQKKEDEEAHALAKVMMSKKASRLYSRMQHGIAKKKAKVDVLHKRRLEIESSKQKNKDGKTPTKQKAERLKKERKAIEDEYSNSGGSMKKRKMSKAS